MKLRTDLGTFRFLVPTEIVFGEGMLNSLGKRCAGLGSKPLVITGKNSAKRSGALDRVLTQLPGAQVYDGIDENPATADCERGGEICREQGCDFVVAIGGGSPIDVAKAVAVLATNPGPCADYFGSEQYTSAPLPIVAVPTTAGAGSETTPYSVIVDEATQTKNTIRGRGLFPAIALLDPVLTVSMPKHVTINSGLDALSQGLEGMVARNATPMGDILALETCRIVHEWLPRAVENPNDMEARAQMLYAATLSGCVIAQSGTTLVHGMGYAYTTECGVVHGLANALLLTPLMEFNAGHCPAKVAALCGAMGRPTEADPERAGQTIGAILHELLAELGVSPAARDAGVDGGKLADFARALHANEGRLRNQLGNPTRDDIMWFYIQSYEGHRIFS